MTPQPLLPAHLAPRMISPHKAVLSIGRYMWLLPYGVDEEYARNLVASLFGIREIDRRIIYGDPTDEDPHGIRKRAERLVVEADEADVSIMATPLGTVVGLDKWEEIVKEVKGIPADPPAGGGT